MKKLLLIALVIIAAVAFYSLLVKQSTHRPKVWITLPDGTSASILAVTYGTNHMVGKALARVVTRLPDRVQDLLPDIFGVGGLHAMITSGPELVVWVQRRTNGIGAMPPISSGYFNAFLGDESNFVSGTEAIMPGWMPGFEVQPVQFKVLPRRDREITLNFFYHNATGGVTNCGSLPFVNPVYSNYPEWKPEPLPATKRAGDVEVTLLGFQTGHGNNSTTRPLKGGGNEVIYDTNRPDGRNNTVVDLTMRSLTDTNEVWQVAGEEISDATGNVARNSGMSSSGTASFSFNPSLWPRETAWKIKLEIKRNQGFRPDEVFVFKDVPLGQLDFTNIIGWTTNFAGVTVTLEHIYRRPPNTNDSWSTAEMSAVKFTTSALPTGTHLDLLGSVFTLGKTNQTESWESSGNERTYHFRGIPLDAKTADFTFAVQQSRTVEFLAKPELPASINATKH
jgi:hypothetical protein